MGNFSSKEAHTPPGFHAESFHTPPSSPQRDEAAFSPSVPSGPPTSPPPPPPALASSGKKPHNATPSTPTIPSTPNTTSSPTIPTTPITPTIPSAPSKAPPAPSWRPPPPSNAASIQSGLVVRGHASPGRNGAPPTSTPKLSASVAPPLSSSCSPVENNLKEEEELQEVLKDCRTTLGISSSSRDKTSTTTEIVKLLLTEVKSLKSTLQTERADWLQFQSDLQVAVSVADRLRAEADEELAALRTSRRETERELAAAQQRLKEADAQLASLRGELSDSRRKLTEEKLNADSSEGVQRGRERGGAEPRSGRDVLKVESMGVAKRHLRNLTNEERSGEELRMGGVRRPWTSERSRSLSRLPASSDSFTTQNGSTQSNTSTTVGSSNKNVGLQRGHKSLDRQDSKSNNESGNREESLNKYNSALTELPPTKSQDGFNLLLRRHGGSKRNSLLRWCQNRTMGYKNIEITNFSSSWADGLAFCALYHTYLPSHVPYSSLRPDNKKENLSLAFRTGETVGITQTLTMEEMQRSGGPDWQRVLGYVENVYRHFEM